MFDDDESTMNSDVSSLPKEESDIYGESEAVTSDPEEKSLFHGKYGAPIYPYPYIILSPCLHDMACLGLGAARWLRIL
jgi:hypothetical protein